MIQKKDWLNETAEFLATETIKLVRGVGVRNKLGKRLMTRFLRHYVKELTLDTLKEHAGKSGAAYDVTKNNYEVLKFELQEEIALGLEEATKQFSGMDLHYVCTLTLVSRTSKNQVN